MDAADKREPQDNSSATTDELKITPPLALLLTAIAVALLLPIWLVRYPPLLDYPDHLARSFILYHLHDPAFRFAGFYRADWGPYPYILMDVTLIALQRVATAEVAGKILLSLSVLALPAGIWYFIRQANPKQDALALWGLLLSYNAFFLEGFLSFQLGLALAIVTIALRLRYLKRPSTATWLAVLALATATYFTHLIAFALAGFVVVVYTAADRRGIRKIISAGLPFLPGALLYIESGLGHHNGTDLYFRSWPEKFPDGVAALLHGYSQRFESYALWVILACIVLAWFSNSEFRLHRPWAVVLVGLVLLYCALPDGFGEAWDVDVRVIPVLFVAGLALANAGRRQRLIAAVALLLFAFRTADVTVNFIAKQPELASMDRAVQLLPRNARLLPLIAENDDDDPIDRLYPHFWAYAIIERGAVAPYLFDLPGQTPMRITDDVYTPDQPLTQPPDWDGIREDYDYIWKINSPGPNAQPNPQQDAPINAQLAAIAKLVYADGNLRLYRLPDARVPDASIPNATGDAPSPRDH